MCSADRRGGKKRGRENLCKVSKVPFGLDLWHVLYQLDDLASSSAKNIIGGGDLN